jgi:hypothetical protein
MENRSEKVIPGYAGGRSAMRSHEDSNVDTTAIQVTLSYYGVAHHLYIYIYIEEQSCT